MKKIYLLSIIGTLAITPLMGQKISTDPNNPINEERPALANNFNWMDRLLTVYHPDGGYVDGNNNPIQLGSPYFEREEYQNHFNLFNYDLSLPPSEERSKLYFHPKDGWELLHKNNGFESDELTLITDPLINRVGPYFMLYNRYTGKIRILASFDGIGANDNIVTTLKFKQPTSGAPSLVYNALFNNYGPTSQPLDQQTIVSEISEASKAAINRGFISSDFQMSYDPCTCENQSELIVDFATLNEADMTLNGRLIATSVPLDGSGNSPLLNREDFLTQVYKDNFSVNGGMLTYKNIDALVEKYEQPELTDFETVGLSAIKAALNGTASAIDKSIIAPGTAIVFNSIFEDLPFYKDQKSVGLGIMAAGAKSLTAELFPSHSVPNINFIEGEMVLTGTLEDETPFNNGSINLAVPGSNGSESVQGQYYPAYNKTMGLFSLLETPSVIYSIQEGEDQNPLYDDFYDFKFFKLNSEIKYALNPESKINLNETRILGALEVKLSTLEGDHEHNPAFYRINQNLQPIYDAKNNNDVFITPFVPIENLQDIVAKQLLSIEWDSDRPSFRRDYLANIDVNLKLLVEFTFESNSYGKINKSIQVFTYPVTLSSNQSASASFQDLNEIQKNWESTLDLVNPQASFYRQEAWDKITLNHKVVSIPATQKGGSDYFVFKANQIHLKDGAHIGPGVTLKAGLPLPEREKTEPKNGSYITDYCQRTYQGNQYYGNMNLVQNVMESTQVTTSNSRLDSLSSGIVIYPNPNRGFFTIKFEEPATTCKAIRVLSSSNEILNERSIQNNESIVDINMASAQSGFYYVKFLFQEGTITKRVWIQ